MKPENIKKVWEHYRGFQIRYRIGRSQYIIDAFNKNMNGDFSPSLFINPIESKVHLIVKEYIKCLLEQEALEQAQQEQTTIDTQQKSPTETQPQEQSTPTIEKTQKEQAQQLKTHKGHNSPPIPRKGGVRRSREVVKENHPQTRHHNPKLHKARRATTAHLSKGGCRLRLRGLRKARRAKAPALKFTKEILGEVSRSDEVVKKLSQNFCGFHRVSLMFILSFCQKNTTPMKI